MLQFLNNLCGPLLDMLQYVHTIFALGSPELGTAEQMGLISAELRGRISYPDLLETPLLTQSRTMLALCSKGTLPAHVQLVVHQDSWVLLFRAADKHILVHGVVSPIVEDFAFPVVNFIRLFFPCAVLGIPLC